MDTQWSKLYILIRVARRYLGASAGKGLMLFKVLYIYWGKSLIRIFSTKLKKIEYKG